MKSYNKTERMMNIINRAVKEFGMEIDADNTMNDLLAQAEDELMDSIEYDRFDICELSSNKSTYSYNDCMGYERTVSGDLFSPEDQDREWYRLSYGKMNEIEWHEATDNDYFKVDRIIDSEAKVVILVAKNS